MAKFYIATQIDRSKEHNIVRDLLIKEGHIITYDWTVHGSVRRSSIERLTGVAHNMMQAVRDADFVVVLLPGGKGTHTEFGAALALGKKIFVHCEDEEVFLPTEKTSAFYHHPLVTKIVCPFHEFVISGIYGPVHSSSRDC
jgi:hypothetical protein